MAQWRSFAAKARAVATPSVMFVVLAAIIVALVVSFAPTTVRPTGGEEMVDVQGTKKEALDITLEMNKLVISLASLIFGAVGTLVIGKDDLRRLRKPQTLLATLALLFASAALYFSYLVYDELVVMLGHNFLEFSDKAFRWPRLFQINSLGLAVVMLAAFFLSMIREAPQGDRP